MTSALPFVLKFSGNVSPGHENPENLGWVGRLALPVSGASVAVFRMLFGVVAAIGAFRFLLKGWVSELYVDPAHHLTYAGFDWVHPLPSPFMHLHMIALGLLGIAIAVGYRYRLCMVAYAIGFAYTELIDSALYLNHYWWVTVASVVMIGLPLNRMWSLDARAGRVQASSTVPSWTLFTVQGLLAVVYLFAGLAKLQSDWLVQAQPMSIWLSDRTDVPVVGPLLSDPIAAYVASWSGAAFDCTIVFWLLWRRSRPFAYMAVIAFHVATAMLFQIGMFPWLMIAGTLVFFSPDWPLRVARRAGLRLSVPKTSITVRRVPVLPLLILVVLQLVIPLRHLAYEGDVRWTEEGYYGAWRVMLTEKGGTADFRVTDPSSGEQWTVNPTSVLTTWQANQAYVRPDLLVAAARLVKQEFARNGHAGVEVRADAFVSFNGRPNQRIVDPSVDLASASRAPGHKNYVLPLDPATPG